MRTRSLPVALIPVVLAFLVTAPAPAQEDSVYVTTKLTESLYELTADGGGYPVKVIVSVGEDGLLLVDSGQAQSAEALKATIQRQWNATPSIIVNTHVHEEHTGANALFGKKATIIGHTNLRSRMRSGIYLFDENPDESLPEIVFTDSMSLHFNGEEIKLVAFTGAHDNSDIIIWFTGSKVACVGALSNGAHFPSVDGGVGDVLKYPEIVARLIDYLPDDVTIIPGHGEDGTLNDLRAFHAMLVKTTAIVRAGLAAGKDLEMLRKEDILADYTSFECSYVDKNQWIKILMDGIEKRPIKKALFEPLYDALKEGGPSAAIARYYELKDSGTTEYRFDGEDLTYIGYKLFGKGRVADSMSFFEASLKERPDGVYNWLCHHYLAKGYMEAGDKARALECFKKSIEINPGNAEAGELIRQLEGEGDAKRD